MHSQSYTAKDITTEEGEAHDTFSATPSQGWAVIISASGGKGAFPASDCCGHSGKNTAPGVTSAHQKTGCAKGKIGV